VHQRTVIATVIPEQVQYLEFPDFPFKDFLVAVDDRFADDASTILRRELSPATREKENGKK